MQTHNLKHQVVWLRLHYVFGTNLHIRSSRKWRLQESKVLQQSLKMSKIERGWSISVTELMMARIQQGLRVRVCTGWWITEWHHLAYIQCEFVKNINGQIWAWNALTVSVSVQRLYTVLTYSTINKSTENQWKMFHRRHLIISAILFEEADCCC